MKRSRSRPLAWLALLGAASVLVGSSVSGSDPREGDGGVVEPVVRHRADVAPGSAAAPASAAASAAAPASVLLANLKRAPSEEKVIDVFAGKSWLPPAPPPPPPVPVRAEPPPPPPAPVAPPLPFTYVGRFQVEDEKGQFYLGRGDRLFTVSEGDVIEDTYRVDGVEGDDLVIVYLPLATRQPLRIGADR